MNDKTYEILHLLLTNGSAGISLEELAQRYQVSVRSIRNYLGIIDDFFQQNGRKDIISRTNGKIAYLGTPQEAEKLLRLALDTSFYEYRLSSKERQFIISVLLLLSEKPIRLIDLEEYLSISRSTIVKEMALVSKGLEGIGISFSENKHHGFQLDVSESVRRNSLYRMARNMGFSIEELLKGKECGICTGFLRHQINLDLYLHRAETALSIVEQHFHIAMSDHDFYAMVFMICLSLYRIACGRQIEEGYRPEQPGDPNICRATEHLAKLLFDDGSIHAAELAYLEDKLYFRAVMEDGNPVQENAINFYIIVKSLLYKLSCSYQIDLYSDYKLQQFLTAHITGIYHRLHDGEQLSNPYKEQLIQDFAEDFRILKRDIDILEESLGKQLSDDEITYILMHIEAALERMRQNQRLPNILIVCHAGFGTSHFLAEMLKKHFKLNILGILSVHNIQQEALSKQQELLKRCDFIVSTVPLLDIPLPIPWIQVDAMLNTEDMERIRQMITGISMNLTALPQPEKEEKQGMIVRQFEQKKKALPNPPSQAILHFTDILDREAILLDKTADDWKEALILAGEPLLWQNKVTPDYIRAMVNNVLDYGPYFVFAPRVAIAHASPQDGALVFGASLVRFSRPVSFGHKHNDPVTLIVALALTDPKEHLDLLFSIMNLLCSPEVVDRLQQATAPEEVLDILKRYEHTRS